jgi:RND family efflux transporter MFP subunit
MKKFWIVIIAVFSLGAGIVLGSSLFGGGGDGAPMEESASKQQYTCGMHPEIISDEPGYCPICEMKLTPIRQEASQTQSGDRKIAYWVAPMDPTYIRNEPGKSPMGMDLVPVYEDQVAGSIIKIDPVTSQNMGLKMAVAREEALSKTITTVAHIDYDEERMYGVNSKVAGWIEKLYVDYEGQSIGKGDPIVEIYSPDLVTAQQEYLSALKNRDILKEASLVSAREGAVDLLKAARDRLLLWDVSEKQIAELEKSGVVRKTMTLYSPADGVVIGKMVVEGDKVSPGMNLFQVADLSNVWALAHIYEYELPFVKMGQEVELSLPYLPGNYFSAKIAFIYPYLDSQTRDVKIRIEIPNRDLLLKPNMYADARIESSLPGKRLMIPSEAVIRSGLRNLVFVSLGDGKFLPREVELGVQGQDDMIEISSGLNAGDVVVTSSQFMLDSESRLREATNKIRAQMASATIVKDEPMDEHQHEQEEHPEAEMKQMKMDETKKAEENSQKTGQQDEKPEQKLSGIYTCPMDSHAHIVQMGPGKCPECGMKLVPAEETSGRTVYVCPMPKDSVVSAEPGRCPKCGMELVEKTFGTKEEGHSHEMTEKTAEHEMEGKTMQAEEVSGIYTCPMDSHAHIVQMGPGKCPECGMKLVPAEETSGRKVYVCPMPKDSVVSAEPGRCPKCGMELVEKVIESDKK